MTWGRATLAEFQVLAGRYRWQWGPTKREGGWMVRELREKALGCPRAFIFKGSALPKDLLCVGVPKVRE